MDKEKLVGKTIKDVKRHGLKGYDDVPYIELIFDDDTSVFIGASYGGYTGKSEDEYPAYIIFDCRVDEQSLYEAKL